MKCTQPVFEFVKQDSSGTCRRSPFFCRNALPIIYGNNALSPVNTFLVSKSGGNTDVLRKSGDQRDKYIKAESSYRE